MEPFHPNDVHNVGRLQLAHFSVVYRSANIFKPITPPQKAMIINDTMTGVIPQHP